LAEHGIEASLSGDRPDLADRLGELQETARRATVRVLVAGEFKHGKSSLVNALVGADVCPVDDDIATAVPTALHNAPELVAVAVTVDEDGTEQREVLDVAALPEHVTEGGRRDGPPAVLVEVGVPSAALDGGLELVDLPGAGGLGSLHGAATLAELHGTTAAIFASDAVQELTAPELAFLAEVAGRCPQVALVETKVDLHPHWRETVDRDLTNAGDRVATVIGVSVELARTARDRADAELRAESGIDEVAAWLQDEVVARADDRLAVAVADEVLEVCRQVRSPLDAELAAIDDPAGQERRLADFEAARAEAERLRAAASRWQQVLNDAFADLTVDADHDLRVRARELARRSDEAIDGFDPDDSWDDYEPVLRREVTSAVADHFATIHGRVTETAERVAEVFAEAAEEIVALAGAAMPAPEDPGPPDVAVAGPTAAGTAKRLGVGGQALALARGSYSPSLMFGFLGGVVGITLATPALLALGLVAGGKGLRTEKQRRLAARQAQAKASARKFVDEVVFQVSKDSRDHIRMTQRGLKAAFVAKADELARSANDTLAAAKREVEGKEAAARRSLLVGALEDLDTVVDLAERVKEAVSGPDES
jgi:hypothetical protein